MIWLNTIGLILVGGGVIVGIIPPSVGARWGGDDTDREEKRLRVRYAIATALVLIGTALQVYATWPIEPVALPTIMDRG
jgi:hypothetical protein